MCEGLCVLLLLGWGEGRAPSVGCVLLQGCKCTAWLFCSSPLSGLMGRLCSVTGPLAGLHVTAKKWCGRHGPMVLQHHAVSAVAIVVTFGRLDLAWMWIGRGR